MVDIYQKNGIKLKIKSIGFGFFRLIGLMVR